MPEQAPLIRRELEAHLIARALKDEGFRQQLIANPKAALEAELARLHLDIKLPGTLEVKVLEETPTTLYLVLPPDLIAAGKSSDEYLLATVRSFMVEDG